MANPNDQYQNEPFDPHYMSAEGRYSVLLIYFLFDQKCSSAMRPVRRTFCTFEFKVAV